MAEINLKTHRGFSLIEIMVALIISLIILATVYANLVSDRRAYATSRATIELVSKNRMSQNALNLYLYQAGFRNYQQIFDMTTFSAEASGHGFNWQEGQFIHGINDALGDAFDDAKPNSDVVFIRYFGADASSGAIYLCDGSTLGENEVASIALYINDANELICEHNSTATVLDDGIEAFELEFGSTDSAAPQYEDASAINQWTEINRVKYALLVRETLNENFINNEQTYDVLGKSFASKDKALRQVVTQTLVLANQGTQF